MSQWLRQTNQKLYFSRLLLAQQATTEDKSTQNALAEGALYLLESSWNSYLNELADAVAIRHPVSSLDHLLEVTPLVTGEMQEIKQLANLDGTWLNQLLVVFANLNAESDSAQVQTVTPSLIATSSSKSLCEMDLWQGLSDLIDRQRANRVES